MTLVLKTAPVLFAYSFVAIAGHLGLLLLVGGALGLSRKDLLLASNANIGGVCAYLTMDPPSPVYQWFTNIGGTCAHLSD